MYLPLQRNFDGGPVRQALMAQAQANAEGQADSSLWAERATRSAKAAAALCDPDVWDALMAQYSERWFESRTWKDQAEAFGRLHARLVAHEAAQYELAYLPELVLAFGPPDVPVN